MRKLVLQPKIQSPECMACKQVGAFLLDFGKSAQGRYYRTQSAFLAFRQSVRMAFAMDPPQES